MIYDYKTRDGRVISRESDEGAVITLDDGSEARMFRMKSGTLRRADDVFSVRVAPNGFVSNFFMENEGRGVPGMEAPAYSKDNFPAFENARQAREFALKHGVHFGERGGSPPRWI